MSGTQNPLAAAMPGMPAAAAPTNAAGNATIPPAAPPQRQGPPPVDAIMGQFRAAGLGPDDFPRVMARTSYLSDTMAKLAAKANVTRKDVVKAAADAVGSRHVTAEEAIGFLGQLPDDGEQLHMWVQQMHQKILAGSVALHAYGHEMLNQMERPGAPVPGGPAMAPQGTAPPAMPQMPGGGGAT